MNIKEKSENWKPPMSKLRAHFSKILYYELKGRDDFQGTYKNLPDGLMSGSASEHH